VAKRLRRPIRKNYYSPKRRAIYAKGEKIDHLAVFEAHKWICCLCQKQIDKRLRHPNLWAATLEHIVPISQGGTHTYDNVAPAHAKCNFARGDRLDFQRAV
jgi:5-methylcytosine-specific restriction endonuclease McrA